MKTNKDTTTESDQHAGREMAFTVTSEAWYSRLVPKEDPRICLGLYSPSGGSTVEFSFQWHQLGRDFLAARLEIFEDSWGALAEIQRRTHGRFLHELEALDCTHPTEKDIVAMLLRLGFIDRTERVNPSGPARPGTAERIRQNFPELLAGPEPAAFAELAAGLKEARNE